MLKTFEWNERYRLGVPEMDAEHLELIKRVNSLVIAFNSEKSKKEIYDILTFLDEYVISHFGHEEKLMIEAGYPQTEQHQAIHDDYINRVDELSRAMWDEGVTPALMVDVNRLLIEWLSQHIDEEDRAFARYWLEKH